jgi:hypothetical protein
LLNDTALGLGVVTANPQSFRARWHRQKSKPRSLENFSGTPRDDRASVRVDPAKIFHGRLVAKAAMPR